MSGNKYYKRVILSYEFKNLIHWEYITFLHVLDLAICPLNTGSKGPQHKKTENLTCSVLEHSYSNC